MLDPPDEDGGQRRHPHGHEEVHLVGDAARPGGEEVALRAEQQERAVDHPLQEDPEAEGGQCQVDAGEADGRDGHDGPDRHGQQGGAEEGHRPRQVGVDPEMAEGGGADGHEGGVAQRYLPRRLHQQAERQEDHDVGRAADPDLELGADDERDQGHGTGEGQQRHPPPGGGDRGEVAGGLPADLADLEQRTLLGGDEDGEEDEERHARREAQQRREVGGVALADGGGDADGQAADEGHADVAEPADGGGAEGLHHQQREQERVEPEDGGQQDARRRGHHRPDDPGRPADAGGVEARQLEQRRVVDDAPHGHAEAGAAQDQRQPGAGDDADHHQDHLVPADVDARHLERLGGQELRQRDDGRAVDDRGQPEEHQQQPDGGDDPEGGGGAGQPAADQLQGHAHRWAEQEHAHRHGQGPRHSVLVVQLVEEVGTGRGDGAVGEVEDARRPVGQHQPDTGQAVDGAGGEADDDEGEEGVHGLTLRGATAEAESMRSWTRRRRCSSVRRRAMM